ncbi:beta-ketoacyl-ACP synthase 3 [Buchananella hordeovulneris]|uniref:beta-ketoacyl-ACP synthase 3 n=1 Tax=Buchananella hordeovulneris TaxID=52770 RepID=UPI0026DCD657|nr:beta-ketoacyl-ACP synthase 3 [Buchananella hordeovulneris]MDO5080339.1 beta-ketoacyl-ACP synthase 3 [Buchananella hordeovulneris]
MISTAPVAGSRLAGVGGVRGSRVVPNADIIGPINSSDEWIRQRTGMVTRCRVSPDQTLLSLSVQASQAALAQADLSVADVDAVIVATITHFEQTPAIAPQVAAALGCGPVPAWDISAACAGYCYAVAQADALVRAGSNRCVLVIGAEVLSQFIDPADRTISFLLGDGAGAAVVVPSSTPQIARTVWGAEGDKACLVGQTASWLDYAANPEEVSVPVLHQEGPSVFKWAVFSVAKVAEAAIAAAGLQATDIDVFIPHQANMRIVESMAKRLGLRADCVIADDIVTTGNTSSASVPLATEALYRAGRVKGGETALQIGFGAGLAYAAQVVTLPTPNPTAE